jgi:tetratricopeptide (TPR) repeat protein
MHHRPEIISLLGIPYYAEPAEKEALEKLQKELTEAEEALLAAPDDPENKVMVGRRLAYLWRYHESIASYSLSLADHPDFAPLYRHRGHRYISIRRFGAASRDLAHASQLQPNDFDILYHLGLALWLQGDYQGAKKAYEAYLPLCENDDQRVPLSYWLYSTLRRLDLNAEAAEILDGLGDDLDIKEDSVYYFNILRLFRGELTEADIFELMKENDLAAGTIGYGLGLWHLFADRKEEANQSFQSVLKGKYWPAFGFIAAEVEIARLEGFLPY